MIFSFILDSTKRVHWKKRTRDTFLQETFLANQAVEQEKENVSKKTRKPTTAKQFSPQLLCDKKCKKKCADKIDVEQQQKIFKTYWESSNWTQKSLLLRDYVSKTPVANRISRLNPIIPLKNRKFNCAYTFPDENKTHHEVCVNFFTRCLCIPRSRIYYSLNSMENNPSALEQRGKGPSKNKTPKEDVEAVMKFIKSLPTYEPHYDRSESEKKYLSPHLNLTLLYKEFKESRLREEKQPVSDFTFRRIFKKKFNLSFKRRKSDICKTCDTLNVEGNRTEGNQRAEVDAKRQAHHSTVSHVNSEFKEDVRMAKITGDTLVITFDLQKSLETPLLTDPMAYCKRQLWTYNLCVYDEVWDKGEKNISDDTNTKTLKY